MHDKFCEPNPEILEMKLDMYVKHKELRKMGSKISFHIQIIISMCY